VNNADDWLPLQVSGLWLAGIPMPGHTELAPIFPSVPPPRTQWLSGLVYKWETPIRTPVARLLQCCMFRSLLFVRYHRNFRLNCLLFWAIVSIPLILWVSRRSVCNSFIFAYPQQFYGLILGEYAEVFSLLGAKITLCICYLFWYECEHSELVLMWMCVNISNNKTLVRKCVLWWK